MPGSPSRTIFSGVLPYLRSIFDRGIISVGTSSSTVFLSHFQHFGKASELASRVHSFARFSLQRSTTLMHGSLFVDTSKEPCLYYYIDVMQ